MKGAITVVNVRRDKRPAITYIGRRVAGYKASPLGNPFKVGEHDDPISAYRRWLWQQLQSDTPARREILRLADLHNAGEDILLGCWCAPDACHGDIVKVAIEWVAGGERIMSTDQPTHEVDCPHSDCGTRMRIRGYPPAGEYDCKCKVKRLRLSWSTSMTFERKPYLTLIERDSTP